jgi:integrase
MREMTGSLQIKNGKYYIVLNTMDEHGKRKQKWSSTGLIAKGNKRRAEAMLRGALTNYTGQNNESRNSLLFSDWIREWLRGKSGQVGVITAEHYAILAETQVFPYFDAFGVKLRDVSLDMLQTYFDEKCKSGKRDGSGGLSPRTMLHLKNIIRQSLKEAVKQGLSASNPCEFVTLPKRQRLEYTFYSEDRINALLTAVKKEPLYPLIRVTAIYGLRRSEVLGLKWDSVDFERDMLTIKHTVVLQKSIVRKDTTKTASSYRSFPLIADIRKMLLSLKSDEEKNRRLFAGAYNENEYIFKWDDGTPLRPEYVTNKFRKLLKQHNLPRIRFHDLRHSCASLLISKGFGLKDVQEWLGHADISMTANIYSHLDLKRKQSIAQSMANTVVC